MFAHRGWYNLNTQFMIIIITTYDVNLVLNVSTIRGTSIIGLDGVKGNLNENIICSIEPCVQRLRKREMIGVFAGLCFPVSVS